MLEETVSFLKDPRLIVNPKTIIKYLKSVESKEIYDSCVFLSVDLERNMRSSQEFKDVVSQTNKIIQLFNNFDLKATFFVSGRIAREFPELIKEIDSFFEVGYHGHNHRNWGVRRWDMPEPLSPKQKEKRLKKDLDFFKEELGIEPVSFRAPGLNTSRETSKLIAKNGFMFDCSYPSFLNGKQEVTKKIFEENELWQLPVSFSKKPRFRVKKKIPYFKYLFLDGEQIKKQKNFTELIKESITEFNEKKILSMFFHQWDFQEKKDIKKLKRTLKKLKNKETEFKQTNELENIDDLN